MIGASQRRGTRMGAETGTGRTQAATAQQAPAAGLRPPAVSGECGRPARVLVAGIPVDCVDMEQALDTVDRLVATGGPARTILAVNPEKVMQARADPLLRRALANAGLVIPDGTGVVLAVRLLERQRIRRVAGADLMPAICERAARQGYSVFLYGASPEVNERAAAALLADYPNLRIVGREHGFVRADDMPALIDRINAAAPDILFVALGSPRQEQWMEEHLPRLKVKVCQGVGGTFDVLSGRVKRAPLVFRRASLEWFYRLCADPRRIRRQMALPRFVYWLALERMRQSASAQGPG